MRKESNIHAAYYYTCLFAQNSHSPIKISLFSNKPLIDVIVPSSLSFFPSCDGENLSNLKKIQFCTPFPKYQVSSLSIYHRISCVRRNQQGFLLPKIHIQNRKWYPNGPWTLAAQYHAHWPMVQNLSIILSPTFPLCSSMPFTQALMLSQESRAHYYSSAPLVKKP